MDPASTQLGTPLPHWRPPPHPGDPFPEGRTCRLIPLDPSGHTQALFNATVQAASPDLWTYLPASPPQNEAAFRTFLEQRRADPASVGWVITRAEDATVLGTASYLRIDRPNGVLEIGWLIFGPALQRTTPATEALFLMIDHAFVLGYRRVEWKCDALNQPSRAAALRLGFSLEGIFRQAVVVKGRNRDTAWFSIIDSEWSAIRPAFVQWLDPGNFGPDGRQRRPLAARRTALVPGGGG